MNQQEDSSMLSKRVHQFQQNQFKQFQIIKSFPQEENALTSRGEAYFSSFSFKHYRERP